MLKRNDFLISIFKLKCNYFMFLSLILINIAPIARHLEFRTRISFSLRLSLHSQGCF